MIKKLNEVKDVGLRLIQYGDSGAGKSVRASEATRWGLVEYHDFDDKIQNLREVLTKYFPDRLERIQIVSYAGLTDSEKIKQFLGRIEQLKKDPGEVATLVIDSYTRFEDVYFAQLMSSFIPSGGGFGSPRTNIKLEGREFSVPGTKDSTVLAAAIKKLIGWLKDIGLNVIFNAHVREYIESKSGISDQGTLAAYGQIRGFLPSEFHEFHRLFADALGKRKVQVRADAYYLANSALSDIPTNGILMNNSLEAFDSRAYKKL